MKRKTIIGMFTLLLVALYSCKTSTGNQEKTGYSGTDNIYKNEASRLPMTPVPMDWEEFCTGEIDLSFLLEKPAGKDGFIEARDGHYYTPSGRRIKFWGVNLTGGACFPMKKDAARVAEFYSRLGINVVRLHFLDSDWGGENSLFFENSSTTREFNPEMLDRLDFFISELKKHGIYSNINLLVGRVFREGDGVKEWDCIGRAKGITLFNDRIIKLEKEYAKLLLTHRNSYTGNQYINEPAVAVVELVNENSLTEAWMEGRLKGTNTKKNASNWSDITPHYAHELTLKYNQWLNGTQEEEVIREIRKESGAGSEELVERLNPDEFAAASKLRFSTEAEFLIETEKNFHTGMYDYLKNELKLKAVVIGNSDHGHRSPKYALLSVLALLDGVDGHVYWQHPSYKRDSTGERTGFSIGNSPMVNDPLNSTIVQLARSAVEGKPYTVSETNHPYPSEFACEGFGILSAYADLQDWDGIYFYTMEHSDPGSWSESKFSFFDLYGDPMRLANLAIGGIMFQRSDFKPSVSTVLRNYSNEQIIHGMKGDDSTGPFFTPGFPQHIPLVQKTRINSFQTPSEEYPSMDLKDPIVSETGELTWFHGNNKSHVIIDSEKSQGLLGFISEEKTATQNLSVDVENKFCSVILTSLDENSIKEAEELLLTTTSRSGLSGMKWNEERTGLLEFGQKPALIEPVKGSVNLHGLKVFSHAEVSYLDGSGGRIKTREFKSGKKMSIPVGDPASVWCLIRIMRD